MTNSEIIEVLDRVRTWPREQQEELARIALELESQHTTSHDLTDEQVLEVRRIRRDVRVGKIASDEQIAELRKACGLEAALLHRSSSTPRKYSLPHLRAQSARCNGGR